MIKRVLPWAILAGVAAVLAIAGFWLLFTTFMVYDDEGYVLISLKNFSEHGGLYDQVYSQYGPFPYLLYDGLHRLLGFAFTNTTARWITLVNWLGTAGVCTILVARQTRSALWATFTLSATFTYLWVMIREPGHPGGLIVMMVALGAWLGAEAWQAGRIRSFAILTAACGGALALTKINVGVFFLASAFIWLALHTQKPVVARWLAWLIALGCALLPFILMRALLDAPWVRLYALIFAGSALAIVMTSRMTARPRVSASDWAWFAGTSLGTMTTVCALALARRTTLAGLVDGVLREPFKHPGVYSLAMDWNTGAGAVVAASLALAAWFANGGGPAMPGRHQVARILLLVMGAVFFCLIPTLMLPALIVWGMSYSVSLAWLCAVPLRADDSPDIRIWLALLLVFQFLHAYPVAGSQIVWGTCLYIPLLALALHNATMLSGKWRNPVRVLCGLAVIATVSVFTVQIVKIGWARSATCKPLGLPGAENLRLSDKTTCDLHILVENLHAHADLLFSLPGLYSINLWTGLPTPTQANATHWFSLLPAERQEAILTRLAQSPRAAIVVQRDLLSYLAQHEFHPQGTLYSWITEHFARAFSVDGYEFWVRRGRAIAPLSIARFSPEPDGDHALIVNLSPSHEAIASIDMCDVDSHDHPVSTLTQANAAAFIEPIDPTGKPQGALAPTSFPLMLTGLSRLKLRFPGKTSRPPLGHTLLLLRDQQGNVVTEARVLN